MRNRKLKLISDVVSAAMLAGMLTPLSVLAAPEGGFGWEEVDGKYYWYEEGVKQGLEGRGKEIADPATGEWYWLDSVDGGKMATDKDLYQESSAGQWAENFVEGDWEASTGKWVRYDIDGHMVKGWYENENGTYYFDLTYGTMAKGYAAIEGQEYYFNTETGVKERELGSVPEGNGWKTVDGVEYWYENGIRQGYSIDTSYRGKEIYDPDSDAWYWLDNIDEGKKAVSKDVYQESEADDAGTIGKWVRYDAKGHMVKGWSTNADGTYYFDPVYGTMAKGTVVIDGQEYTFDEGSGILKSYVSVECNLSESNPYYKYEYAYRNHNTSGLSESDMSFYNGLKECLDAAYQYGTPYEQELAVHDWIVLNCAYDYDNYLRGTIPWDSYRPTGVFVHGTAVCQGYAESFQLCMGILGIPCIMVTGTANGGDHAWNAVQLDGDWYMVDTTWDDPVPDEPGRVLYSYFNVTDEVLKRDHYYTSTVEANGTKYNYYASLDNYFTSDEVDAYYAYINAALESAAPGEEIYAIVELVDGTVFYDPDTGGYTGIHSTVYRDRKKITASWSGGYTRFNSPWMATFYFTKSFY